MWSVTLYVNKAKRKINEDTLIEKNLSHVRHKGDRMLTLQRCDKILTIYHDTFVLHINLNYFRHALIFLVEF